MKRHGEVFVGIDTAKVRNAIAVAEGGRDGEIRYLGEFDNTPDAVIKLVRKLADRYETVHFCYEAGPTGYGLYRQIRSLGHECTVVAPSLIPRRPGDRVKTDGKASWRGRHLRWLGGQNFAHPAQRFAYQELLNAVRITADRIDRLEAALVEIVPDWTMAPVVAAFQAMRGVAFSTATTLVAEAGDLRRFDHPRKLMAFLGLVPPERSTGETRRQGGITRAGNARARSRAGRSRVDLPQRNEQRRHAGITTEPADSRNEATG